MSKKSRGHNYKREQRKRTDKEFKALINNEEARALRDLQIRALALKQQEEDIKNLKVHVYAKNEDQQDLLDSLYDNRVRYIAATGIAGSGKTFLACHYAMNMLLKNKVDKIVLLRSVTQVAGEEMGFLPGSVEEKLQFFLQPMISNLKKFSCGQYAELYASKKIEVAPLAMIRGMSFENCIVLVDECQNVSSEILKALLTRIADSSTLIMMGDYKQNDTRKVTTDFEKVCNKLEPMSCFDWIELTKSVRSKNIQEILRLLDT